MKIIVLIMRLRGSWREKYLNSWKLTMEDTTDPSDWSFLPLKVSAGVLQIR